MAEHDSGIRQFYTVKRKLDNALPDKKLTPKVWQSELDRLSQEYAIERAELKSMWADLKKLREIQQRADSALHDQKTQQTREKQRQQQTER